MSKDWNTKVTDEVQFIIDTVPNRDEVFTMHSWQNPYHSYDKERTMSYPKVLDNFTETEKRILFENFMSVYFIDNPEGKDKLRDFMTGVEEKFAPMLESRLISFQTHAIATGMYLPTTQINIFDAPNKYNAIMNFHNDVMTDDQYKEANEYAKKAILTDQEKNVIKEDTLLSDDEVEKGLQMQLIQQNDQFYIDFYNHFHMEYHEALETNFIGSNLFTDSEEFLSWWEKQYGFKYNSEIYNLLYEHWTRIKMDYVLKLYIFHLLDKARKWDPEFDLFEYIQARTHLRILTNIYLLRYAFLKLLKPYEYETFRLSDLMIADTVQWGIMWASILLVLNPALRVGGKALAKYAVRPIVKRLVNCTIPDAALARYLAGAGKKISGIEFEAGSTIAASIEEASAKAAAAEVFKEKVARAGTIDWFYRQLFRWADPERPMKIEYNWLPKRALKSARETYKKSRAEAKAGSKIPWKDKVRIFKETIEELKKYPITKTKKEKLVLGDRQFDIRTISMSWLRRFERNLNKNFKRLTENNPFFYTQQGLSRAQMEKNIKTYINEMLEMDATVLNNIGIVNIRNLPVMLRITEVDGARVGMEAIPFTENNFTKFFAQKPPGAYVHLSDSRLTVLDLRGMTKIKFPTKEITEEEFKKLHLDALIKKGEQEKFAKFLKHYLDQTGRKEIDQWSFAEAVATYLKERAKFDIDAIILEQQESTILKIVSEKLQKELLTSSPRAYRYLSHRKF